MKFGRRSNSKGDGGSPQRRQAPSVGGKKSVFSYYSSPPAGGNGSSRAVAAPDNDTKRTRGQGRPVIQHLPMIVALILLGVVVMYCLSLSTSPKLTVYTARSQQPNQQQSIRNQTEYLDGAQKLLNSSIFNRTKFTINTAAFERAFKAEYPEVSDVAVALPIVSRQPIVTITTAQPAFVIVSHNQSWVIDERGIVIMSAQDLSKTTKEQLPVIIDQSNTPLDFGKAALPSTYVQYIGMFAAQLRAKNISIESIILPNQAHEIDIKPKGQPYIVKTSVDTNAREAAGAYLATKGYLDGQKIKPGQLIDVRVPGRATYK